MDKLIEKIAKLAYQYAYLVDDKKIDKIWEGLSECQTNRFYEYAKTAIPIIRKDAYDKGFKEGIE